MSAASGWLTVGLVDRSVERCTMVWNAVEIKICGAAQEYIESPQAPRI